VETIKLQTAYVCRSVQSLCMWVWTAAWAEHPPLSVTCNTTAAAGMWLAALYKISNRYI